MNINKITACVMVCAALASCNVTEDNYHLGDIGDVRIITDPASQIRLTADGKPREINVSSNVYWNVETLGNRFTVNPSTDKGDGIISVSGPVNINSGENPTETIVISARDFDKKISIEVIQARLNFGMTEQTYPEIPEEGGKLTLGLNSSIDWQFSDKSGSSDWLEFSPAANGVGEWDEIEVTVTCPPNYTTKPRFAELQLRPVDESLIEYISLPASFTLSQAAGTLPTVSISGNGDLENLEYSVTINYSSKSPVLDCGVILTVDNKETRITAIPPEGGFPLNGTETLALSGLERQKRYKVFPYVVSRVGETLGKDALELSTIRQPSEDDNSTIQ